MSSVISSVANTGRGSAFFVAVDTTKKLSSAGVDSLATVPAGALLRDMGKKVTTSSKVLRKVQLSNGVNGTGSGDPWDTFYVEVTGPTATVASLGL